MSGSGGGWTVLQLVRLGATNGQSGAGLEEGSRRLALRPVPGPGSGFDTVSS